MPTYHKDHPLLWCSVCMRQCDQRSHSKSGNWDMHWFLEGGRLDKPCLRALQQRTRLVTSVRTVAEVIVDRGPINRLRAV